MAEGEKGRKLPEISWLDPAAMKALAEVSGTGARKYSPYNYRAGYNWSLSYNALFRHMNAFWDGEDIDPDDGQHHMASAAWHALQLLSASLRGVGNDDRYKGVE